MNIFLNFKLKINILKNLFSVKYEIMIHDLQADVDAQTDRARLPQMSLDSFDYNVYHTLDEVCFIKSVLLTLFIRYREK